MLITVITPDRKLTGSSQMLHHAMTPHSGEKFERDRHSMVVTRQEFEMHLRAGLPMQIGDRAYRLATDEEVAQWRAFLKVEQPGAQR